MNQQDQISSYIDNALSAEAEQEFLISLAASEGLRRSFRSELMLKNILHHDETGSRPPRELRGAVFSAVGLSAASASGGTSSGAHSLFGRILTGVKLNIIATSMIVSLSAGAGYLLHDVTQPSQKVETKTAQLPMRSEPTTTVQTAAPALPSLVQTKVVGTVGQVHSKHHTITRQAASRVENDPVISQPTTSLSGDVNIKPQINSPK